MVNVLRIDSLWMCYWVTQNPGLFAFVLILGVVALHVWFFLRVTEGYHSTIFTGLAYISGLFVLSPLLMWTLSLYRKKRRRVSVTPVSLMKMPVGRSVAVSRTLKHQAADMLMQQQSTQKLEAQNAMQLSAETALRTGHSAQGSSFHDEMSTKQRPLSLPTKGYSTQETRSLNATLRDSAVILQPQSKLDLPVPRGLRSGNNGSLLPSHPKRSSSSDNVGAIDNLLAGHTKHKAKVKGQARRARSKSDAVDPSATSGRIRGTASLLMPLR